MHRAMSAIWRRSTLAAAAAVTAGAIHWSVNARAEAPRQAELQSRYRELRERTDGLLAAVRVTRGQPVPRQEAVDPATGVRRYRARP